MIELLRYASSKPEGLVSASKSMDGLVTITFKRFDVGNGKEVEPEVSVVSMQDLEARMVELQIELDVVKELLLLR